MDSSTPGSSRHQPNVINTPNAESPESRSHFRKTVCLYDWWLTKGQPDSGGNRLAVAGLSSREDETFPSRCLLGKEAVRIFISAPVIKRYSDFSIETADGICIIIRGFINKERTAESGFPSEVFDHFVFGFPPYWERFAVTCFERDSAGGASLDISAFDGCDVNRKGRTSGGMAKSGSDFVPSLSQLDSLGSPVNHQENDIPQHKTSEFARTLSSVQYQTQPSVSNSPVVSMTEDRTNSKTLVKGTKQINLLQITLPSNKKFEGSSDHVASNVTQKMSTKRKNEIEKLLMDHDSSITNIREGISDGGKRRRCNGDAFTSPCSLQHWKKRTMEESPIGRIDIGSSHKSTGSVKNKTKTKGERSSAKETSEIKNNTYVSYDLRTIVCALSVKTKQMWKVKRSSDEEKSEIKNNTYASPKLGGKNHGTPGVSSESSYRKSRSGRLLVPTLEFWRNQLPVYDKDRKLIGIKDGPSVVSVSPPSSRGNGYRLQRS